MARRRFFVDSIRNGQAELSGEEARHLTQVLRVEAGQFYEISDNEHAYLAEVESARKQHVLFRVVEKLPDAPPLPPITLFVALIKFEKLELLIEKATELGVGKIQLIRSDRIDKGLSLAVPKRLPRWQRIALEASQQSRRERLPEIALPVSFGDALRTEADARLYLDEEREGIPLVKSLAAAQRSAALLVGPEGGWTTHEREQAKAAGWNSVSLGPTILKAETAAIAALAVLNCYTAQFGSAK